MKKTIGLILIVLAIVLAYMGYSQVAESTAAVEILGVELKASDQSGQTQGYILLILGIVSLLAGIFLIGKKD
jgi:general stress protein CsbA